MTTQQAAASTAIATTAPRPRSVLLDMADRFAMEPKQFEATVRATCIPTVGAGGRAIECTREQFAAFLIVARDYGLNPLTREIYAFPNKSGGVTPIVGIDGWLSLANRRPEFDGLETIDEIDDKGNIVSVEAIVHRKDRAHATKVREYLSECQRGTEPWKQWPRRMLRHKATIQAIRYAFSISGIYEPDEAERADVIDVTPPPAEPRPTRESVKPAAEPEPDPREGMSDEERERVEREADRLQRAEARGPVAEATLVPQKPDGSPDWLRWHTAVVGRLKTIDDAERAAFLEAHDPALANYAAASPQNAATLRNLIMGTD